MSVASSSHDQGWAIELGSHWIFKQSLGLAVLALPIPAHDNDIFRAQKAGGRALDNSFTGTVFSHPFYDIMIYAAYNMLVNEQNSVLLVLTRNHEKEIFSYFGNRRSSTVSSF